MWLATKFTPVSGTGYGSATFAAAELRWIRNELEVSYTGCNESIVINDGIFCK